MTSIRLKTKQEIEVMAQGGKFLSRVLARLKKYTKPGFGTQELDGLARKWLKELGAEPSFLNYRPGNFGRPYPCGLCISINDEIVHGIARPDRIFQEGDLVSLDLGAKYKGLYTDMAITFNLGRPSKDVKRLIKVTRESLRKALGVVRPGNTIADIGKEIEAHANKFNLGVVRDLVGHGVGFRVHEPPRIPNYYDPALTEIILRPGLCIAIEPMLTLGDYKIKTLADGWTIVTQDGSLSAHAEVTVVVTEKGHKILTPFID